MQKVFRNYLLPAFFLLAYIISTAQREAVKPVDIKSGSSSSSYTSSYNSKGTPAKIKDSYGIWTDFNLRTNADASTVRAQLGDAKFEEVAANCNETAGWPGAITSYEERNKVRDQMLKYVCYQIGEVGDKYILRVPADENKFQPYGVRPEHDIYFIVGKTYVDLTGSATSSSTGSSYSSSSSYTPVSNLKGPRAKIKDSFGIWTDFVLTSKADAAQVKEKLGYALYNDVADNCSETKWPYGISTYTEREKVRSEMKDYVAYQIGESDDKWILRVPASENSFQPSNIRPTRDIYFMVRKTDVDLSGSPINTLSSSSTTTTTSSSYISDKPGSSYYAKTMPAKITATGGMYSTYDFKADSKAAYLEGYWGTANFNDVAKYCKEENWPSGINTLSARDLVRSQMNNYKAYKIAEYDGKYILRIPVDENQFMPYNMRPTHDIYFAINQTDATLLDSKNSSSAKTNSSIPTLHPASKPSGTTTANTTNNSSASIEYGRSATIYTFATLISDYDFDGVSGVVDDLKEAVTASEYTAIRKYNQSKYWPSGIATAKNRETNSKQFDSYKATVVADFFDADFATKYILKLTPKDNTAMSASMRPQNTIYIVVDEDDIDIK